LWNASLRGDCKKPFEAEAILGIPAIASVAPPQAKPFKNNLRVLKVSILDSIIFCRQLIIKLNIVKKLDWFCDY
jgi:hypothetical protein